MNKYLQNYLDTFRSVMDIFPEYVFIKDSEFNYILGNKQWCELNGFYSESYSGKNDYELFVKETAESYIKSDKIVLDTKKSYESFAEQTTADGSRMQIHYSKSPLLTPNGLVCGILGIFRDITLDIEERHRYFRLKDAALEASIEGIAFFNTQGYLIQYNPAFLVFFPGKELVENETVLEDLSDSLFDREVTENIEEFLYSKENNLILPEYRSLLSNRYIGTFLSKVKGTTGKWIGLMLVIRDVTELKEAEERYKNLVQDANSIILKLDSQGRILFFNKHAEKVFGYDQEEVLGHNGLGKIYTDENLIFNIFNKSEQFKNNENENITKDGSKIWVAWTNRLYYDADGMPKEVLCIGNDITRKRDLEKTLFHAQKMEALGTLINGLAHDLNNLLCGITGYMSNIKLQNEHYNDKVIDKSINQVQAIIRNSTELISTILPLGKKDDKKMVRVDLNALMDEAIEIVAHSRLKKAEFLKDYDLALSSCLVIKGEIQQVFLNILLNAVDSIEEEGRIVIRTSISKPAKKTDQGEIAEYYSVSVIDNGCGMDENTLSHIFEPYYTTKEQKKGTGLGLATAYSIIKNHGGFIEVTSEINKGSRFTILLPMTLTVD